MTREHHNRNNAAQPPKGTDWNALFPGDASREAYQNQFRERAPVAWEIVEAGQNDLLRLLVGKISADIGVGVILGLSILFGAHPKSEQASHTFLATLMSDVEPRRLRTVLVTLTAAWQSASSKPLDEREPLIHTEMQRVLRRLSTAPIPDTERGAIVFLQGILGDEQ